MWQLALPKTELQQALVVQNVATEQLAVEEVAAAVAKHAHVPVEQPALPGAKCSPAKNPAVHSQVRCFSVEPPVLRVAGQTSELACAQEPPQAQEPQAQAQAQALQLADVVVACLALEAQ
jgi:hypothetical protein